MLRGLRGSWREPSGFISAINCWRKAARTRGSPLPRPRPSKGRPRSRDRLHRTKIHDQRGALRPPRVGMVYRRRGARKHALLQGLRSTLREKLECLEEAETLTLQLRESRKASAAKANVTPSRPAS